MKKRIFLILILMGGVGLAQASGSVIGVNIRHIGDAAGGGWGYHDAIFRNPNGIFTAGYVRPGGDNWNEIFQPAASSVHNDLVELASGAATTADLTVGTINFTWGQQNNVDGVLTDEQKNNLRIANSQMGFNGGTGKRAIATVTDIPYSQYAVVVYLAIDANGRQSEITVGGTTYYYSSQAGTTWEGNMIAGAPTYDWQIASNTTPGDYTQTANVAIFTPDPNSTLVIDFNCNQNSGIAGFQIVEFDVGSNPVSLNRDTMIKVDQVLSWTAPITYTPTGYDVYLDPNEAYVIEGNITECDYYNPNQPGTSFDPNPDLLYDTTYYWRVDSLGLPDPCTGIVWSFTTEPESPVLTQDIQPTGITVAENGTASFTVGGNNVEEYRWYKVADPADILVWTDVSTAETSTYTDSDVLEADEGEYYCVLWNPAGTDTSSIAGLLTERLISHWKFEGDLSDEVGPDPNGDWPGTMADPNFDAGGIDGTAMRFYRDSRVVTITGSEDYFTFYQHGLTVSLWVKPDVPYVVTGGYFVLAAKNSWWSGNGWVIADKNVYSGGGPQAKVQPQGLGSGNKLDVVNPEIGDNWHLVTLTYDAVAQKTLLYANGREVASADGAANATANTGLVAIGGNADATMELPGLIDEVRIYSYALDSFHVAKLYTDLVAGVEICAEDLPIEYDNNGDCIVDLKDFANFANHWLDCNIVPTCWDG